VAERPELRTWWSRPVAKSPSEKTRRWVAGAIGPDARVVRSRRLKGGLISSVDALTVETRGGKRQQVVLRRHTTWEKGERPAEWVKEEAHVLQALESSGLPAPRLLAVDPDGAESGVPALLMTLMPGRVHLEPSDAWIGQQAATLARVHALEIRADLPKKAERHHQVHPPAAAIDTPVWEEAIAITSEPAPSFTPRFIHGDYQHFNMVWSRGRLTGVLDWGGAAFGPPDRDSGHCRLNLAVLFSAEWAERFRLAYEAEAGRRVDPYWDLSELLAYSSEWQQFIPIQVAGRVPVDTEGMTARVEELIKLTLKRM
jgi:aminoglycoside phosphotransferase (APT) family kinase protein